jgi:UDP-N-acetylglucosamine--N-acetylmuramyl-(pentapeptide) pyrophosphoryl-undecaprenol N-acetylglucosamine transferase
MRLLFAAGGTGGTVLPAIAVAREVRALRPDAEIAFVGTARGFEARLVPQAGYRLETIRTAGLKGMGPWRRIRNFLILPRTFWQCWRILSRFRPQSVCGAGGYASGPVLLLASLRGMKTSVIEPNAVPGFANRVLARFVDRVFLAFEAAAAGLPAGKCVVSGNPIRNDILAVPPPRFEGTKRTVLVFGGSQGARRLNRAVVEALPHLAAWKGRLAFLHQTGTQDEMETREAYRKAGFEAEVFAYADDMAGMYRRSDLVIARAGSSVLEIAATGRPSLLVPYPFAADDHQAANAAVLERAGAAAVLPDAACDGPAVADWIAGMAGSNERLAAMSRAALALRRDGAAAAIARDLLKGAA